MRFDPKTLGTVAAMKVLFQWICAVVASAVLFVVPGADSLTGVVMISLLLLGFFGLIEWLFRGALAEIAKEDRDGAQQLLNVAAGVRAYADRVVDERTRILGMAAREGFHYDGEKLLRSELDDAAPTPTHSDEE